MEEKVTLDDRRIGLLLFKLSLPAFLGMSVMALYNAVDTVFVGHYVGPLGIAALSVAFPVQMCFLGLGQMIGMGAASLTSRSMGAGDMDRARKALGNAITSTLVLSAIVMALVLPRVDGLSRMMGASPEVLPYVRTYLRLILLGAFVQFSPIVLGNLIRAEGNARVPMQGMMLGAGLNIGLDALFIAKMGMGIGGAALGTVISQSVPVVYLCSHYILGHSPLGLRLRAMVPKGDVLTEVYAVGIASFARTVAGSLSVAIINRTLALYGGDMAVSAFGILHRLAMFAVMPSMAIGQGLQPVLGYNYPTLTLPRSKSGYRGAKMA